ncbi:MAG: AAA family ATPase, partial [Anaerolineae bacterium]|nr:AAA family ATPase [Anaerolineae bacterium]
MSGSLAEQIAALKQAIAAQDALRPSLGDAVVEATLAALREKLAALEARAAPPAQQRKQITILFADVSGFTAMAEAMDAEDVTDLMNALWQGLDGAILRHGGTIDKHIGDGVMALWGVDAAREDDAEQAVRAALAMQEALAAFRQAQDRAGRRVSLAIRAGLHTGPVLLGEVGTTGEFSAMGDTVNLASRLEQAAPVGGVLISHDTFRLVRGLFAIQPQPPLLVKGKAEPVQTYVVQRATPRAFRPPTRGIEGIETRMVGRDAELDALKAAYHATQEAITQAVLITGDAGVGKSRLLAEFDRWLAALPDAVVLLRGRARLETRHTPYAVWRDLFARYFGILESDSPATVLERFRAGMAPWLNAERADLVGHLVGFDFSSSDAVHNLLGSPSFARLATAYLVNAMRALAEQPAALFLEDLHWADDRSLDLVTHLLAEIPAGRLLVIGLARPALFERHPDWGAGWTRLDLVPLAEADSRALVADILQKALSVPDDLRDLIVRGAEGNPFYVEELIKMLLDDGVIVRDPSGWRVELARLKAIRVPPTLTGVLQARLDGLPGEERDVLQRASVVGRLFWDETVAELSGETPASDIDPLLARMDDRELVFRHDQSAFEGANEYAFKHAMLRDVTYETVLLKVRRVYHAQVARWLEAHVGARLNEYLSLIAGHYEL